MTKTRPAPFRLVLRQDPAGSAAEPTGDLEPGDSAAGGRAPGDLPEVEFVAFAAHGRLSGRIALDKARLTDMLNEHEAFQLDHVMATRLPEGQSRVIKQLVIERGEIFLVHAGGPRGDRAQRTKTIARAITVKAGPYLVTGDVHTAPGIDPLLFFRKRHPMVPLTDAIVVYQGAYGLLEENVEVVVVNRDLADWVRRAEVIGATSSAGLRNIARNGTGIQITG